MTVPSNYQHQKLKFVALLQSTYVLQTPQIEKERIIQLVGQLVGSPDKEPPEIALEGIGRPSLVKLEPLLKSSDEEVQFRAARCMLNLGNDKGLEALREIAINPDSFYRIEALDAVLLSNQRDTGASLARLLLRDSDFDVKLAAYKNLLVLDDVAIITEFVGRKFYMDQITQSNEKIIYVSRSGKPGIALFGSPLYCRENIFVESSDSEITINAGVGQPEVTVMRKVPKRPNLPPIQLKTSYKVSDIIRALGAEPVVKNRRAQPGLNVSYEEIISLLKQMCEKGIVGAEFREGPLAKIGL
ncbi:MAG: HEAT repeat domain-containing protein [Planctomycetota bacterium]